MPDGVPDPVRVGLEAVRREHQLQRAHAALAGDLGEREVQLLRASGGQHDRHRPLPVDRSVLVERGPAQHQAVLLAGERVVEVDRVEPVADQGHAGHRQPGDRPRVRVRADGHALGVAQLGHQRRRQRRDRQRYDAAVPVGAEADRVEHPLVEPVRPTRDQVRPHRLPAGLGHDLRDRDRPLEPGDQHEALACAPGPQRHQRRPLGTRHQRQRGRRRLQHDAHRGGAGVRLADVRPERGAVSDADLDRLAHWSTPSPWVT